MVTTGETVASGLGDVLDHVTDKSLWRLQPMLQSVECDPRFVGILLGDREGVERPGLPLAVEIQTDKHLPGVPRVPKVAWALYANPTLPSGAGPPWLRLTEGGL